MTTIKDFPRIQWGKDKGNLIAYAFPGGYPVFYITRSCSTLCPGCANENDEEFDPLVDCRINYEDCNLYCDECNTQIESAYGVLRESVDE